ncbi:MAG: homogentisate 1,2-dioxygenase, partial [Myxococcota bacterium]
DLDQVAAQVMRKQYKNPREYEVTDIRSLLGDAWHDRRPSLKTHQKPLPGGSGPHAALKMSTRGVPLSEARTVIIGIHGRGASADRFLGQLEALLPSTEGIALLAPQAWDNSWYPSGFRAPIEDNQPLMDSALSVIEAMFAEAAAQVGAERVVLVGFSQGACLLLTWLSVTDARPRQVLSFTGAHTPLGGDFAAADSASVYLSRSELDPWVDAESFAETVSALEARSGRVAVGLVAGAAHILHESDAAALRHTVEVTMGQDELQYQPGFGNTFMSEALPGAVPRRQNTPRQVKYSLITEQINGTGFTVRRAENLRTWMYRLRPQILDQPLRERDSGRFVGDFSEAVPSPQVMRFKPLALPELPVDFLEGLVTFGGVGDASMRRGAAVHLYAASADMVDTAFCNIDGDLLVVPQHGRLHIRTELGRLNVGPGEIAILPRGIRFQILLRDGTARGWVGELFDGHFQLPERGPVGANGMADERHFLAPVADFEDVLAPWTVVVRQGGRLWEGRQGHSPFDVVGWHGRYAPFKYDLRNFNSLGSVSFDHVDPSILTVLTSPMDTHGRNAIDFGVFLGRWDVTEGTFRPPYFHRNSAIEFNGVVSNTRSDGPWAPGTYTFTPYLTPHGVSSSSYNHVVTASDDEVDPPVRGSDESIWIQFESAYLMKVMPWMLDHPDRDSEYLDGFRDYRPGPALP